MSYPPDPNNPYGQQPQQPQQPGYGYPQQQPPAQPYGYPQQGVPPQAPPQDPYGQQQQPGYGYPQQQPPQPAYGAGYQADPYGNAGYGQAQYATWGSRFGAYLLDGLIVGLIPFILYIIAGVAFAGSVSTTYDSEGFPHTTTSGGAAGLAVVFYLLALAVGLAGALYVSYKEGTTGQSPGKKVLNIRVVREADGQVLGFGMAFVRKLAYFLNSIACYIGWLWPLWDDKSQTFADKVCSTVVLKA
jgi:uncharacterized RDD family membrane protein YckC